MSKKGDSLSNLSIKLEGYPEKVQQIANVIDEALPGLIVWAQAADYGGVFTIKIEGYEVPSMPVPIGRIAKE